MSYHTEYFDVLGCGPNLHVKAGRYTADLPSWIYEYGEDGHAPEGIEVEFDEDRWCDIEIYNILIDGQPVSDEHLAELAKVMNQVVDWDEAALAIDQAKADERAELRINERYDD